MTIPPALLVLLGLLVVGVIDTIVELVRTFSRWRFTEIYGARFDEFVTKWDRRQYEGVADQWLNRKLTAMVTELQKGQPVLYQVPGRFSIANYSLLTDTVTKISQ